MTKVSMDWLNLKESVFINGDCMDYMKTMPDNYVELAIVDPPYGKRPTRGRNGFGSAKTIQFQPKDDKWDKKPDGLYFVELVRVSKNQIIWGGNYFSSMLTDSNGWIVWDKLTGDNPYADCELAWSSFNCSINKFTLLWLGSHCSRIENLIHPTQKPVALYRWLLQNYAKQGDKILDTHTGSASLPIACEIEGFDYVAFELDEDYFRDATKRLKQARKTTIDMFKPSKPIYAKQEELII